MSLTARITRRRRWRSRCPAPGNSHRARLARATPPPRRDSDPGDTTHSLRPSRNHGILTKHTLPDPLRINAAQGPRVSRTHAPLGRLKFSEFLLLSC